MEIAPEAAWLFVAFGVVVLAYVLYTLVFGTEY